MPVSGHGAGTLKWTLNRAEVMNALRAYNFLVSGINRSGIVIFGICRMANMAAKCEEVLFAPAEVNKGFRKKDPGQVHKSRPKSGRLRMLNKKFCLLTCWTPRRHVVASVSLSSVLVISSRILLNNRLP